MSSSSDHRNVVSSLIAKPDIRVCPAVVRHCRDEAVILRGDSMQHSVHSVKEARTHLGRRLSVSLLAGTIDARVSASSLAASRSVARLPRVLYCSLIVGAVAQLGERCVRNAEVEGSTPFRSTCLSLTNE